jgi:ornithine cyclodeaminase/alanine dehydrogenase-like protein (mu-crystallin family)
MLFDADTGLATAVMDGTHITAMRTAAAAALAAKLLARSDAKVLAILGTGVQSRAAQEMFPRAGAFAEVRVAGRGEFEDAVRGADVVCACTHSSEPVLRREWLGAGAHVCSVGASQEGPELDPETVSGGLLAVESRVAFEPPPAGSFELQGMDPAAAVELGELVSGTREGRTAPDQLTVYKSMGHAVEDAAAAALELEAARAQGAGVEVGL